MISYELATKLKDAGFPQDRCYWVILEDGSLEPWHASGCGMHPVYAPALSELVEACSGNENFYLEETWTDTEGWWEAGRNAARAWGYTPEEAVANLWLEMNKKV